MFGVAVALVGAWLRNWVWWGVPKGIWAHQWGLLMQALGNLPTTVGHTCPTMPTHHTGSTRRVWLLPVLVLFQLPLDRGRGLLERTLPCLLDRKPRHCSGPATVGKPRRPPILTLPAVTWYYPTETARDMQMRLGQRVIQSQTGGWTSATCSPARGLFFKNRHFPRRPLFYPGTRASSGTSALCASNMSSANINRNTETMSEAPRHNAWIGSEGAAGHDLRSQLLVLPLGYQKPDN